MPAPTLPSDYPAAAVASPSGYALEFDNVSIGFDEKVLLKLAIGLLRPDSGRISVLGEEVTRMREQDLFELRRRVGIVFQESALFDSLKVYENVAFRLMGERVSAEEVER